MDASRDEHLLLSVTEAATLLAMGRSATYEAIRRGELPSIRIGRRVLVPRHRLEEMLGLTSAQPENRATDR